MHLLTLSSSRVSSHEERRRYAQADHQDCRHQRGWQNSIRRWVLWAQHGRRDTRHGHGHGLLTRCFPEFRSFVETAERQLLQLFRSIDRDKDGRLNKEELRAAFQRAGLSVPMRSLSSFFNEIDMNNDGFISFDEWRYVSQTLIPVVCSEFHIMSSLFSSCHCSLPAPDSLYPLSSQLTTCNFEHPLTTGGPGSEHE